MEYLNREDADNYGGGCTSTRTLMAPVIADVQPVVATTPVTATQAPITLASAPEVEPPVFDAATLEAMNDEQLRAMAKERGFAAWQLMKRPTLIKKLGA